MKKYILRLGIFLACLFIPTIGVNAASAPIISNVDVLHRHTGSSAGGGCYGNPNICGGRMESRTENPHGCGINASGGGCPHCGCWYEPPSSKYPSGCAHCNCPKPTVTRCTSCGREGGGGSCSAIASYSLSCGRTVSTVLGKLSLVASTTEWTDKLTITATINNISLSLASDAYIWNAGAATSSNTIEITANGEYNCRLNVTDESTSNAASAIAKIVIGNIDDVSPTIDSVTADTTEWVSDKVLITISARDGEMGLHAEAYSYDGGNTWIAENTYEYKDNGSYIVFVRDKAENRTQGQIEIKNIDKVEPTIQSIIFDSSPDVISTILNITAVDLQNDGTNGSGLDDVAYSYDGGNTWVVEDTKLITANGDYTVCVRDKMKNSNSQIVTVTNLDSIPPVIVEMTQDPTSWTNGNVTVYVNAMDTGSGIESYSWDNGNTWVPEAINVVNANGYYKVMVKDQCGNISESQKEVMNIDKISPTISWSMSPDEKSWFQNNATVYINATDDLSGVYLYSFNGGATWLRESVLQISDDKNLSIRVRDCAGNIASMEITVKKQLLPILPIVLPKNKNPQDIMKEVVEKKIKKIAPEKITIPSLEAEKKIVKSPEYNSPLPKYNVLPVVATTAAGTSVLTFCAMYFFPLIPIYGKKLNGQYKLIGATIAKRKNKKYYLHLRDFHTKKAETNNFKIRLGKVFAHTNKDKDFIIKLENKEILKKVDRELCF